MTLAEYLRQNELSYAEFGRRAHLPRITVRQYAVGARSRPSQKNLVKIIKATEGRVTANDFYAVADLVKFRGGVS